MESITVSVIVPVYNVERYLAECLDSLLRQTYKALEIIIVDDGSTDNSGSICDRYASKDRRIAKVIHKENGGLSDARNTGMRYASGKYVYFLDSDDYLADNAIAKMLFTAEKYNAEIVSFDSFAFVETGCQDAQYAELRCKHSYPLAKGTVNACKMAQNDEFFFGAPLHFFLLDFLKNSRLSFCKGMLYEDVVFSVPAYLKAERTLHLGMELYGRRIRCDSIMRSSSTIKSVKSYSFCCRRLLELREEYKDDFCAFRFINTVIQDPACEIVRAFAQLPKYDRLLGERYVRRVRSLMRRSGCMKSRNIRLKLGHYRSYSFYLKVKAAAKRFRRQTK